MFDARSFWSKECFWKFVENGEIIYSGKEMRRNKSKRQIFPPDKESRQIWLN